MKSDISMLEKTSLFKTLTKEELDVCYKEMEKKQYQKGDIIIQEGDNGSEIYIITAGSVGVFKTKPGSSQPHLLTTIATGVEFGELALIDNSPRSSSIIAMESTEVFVMTRDKYNALSKDMNLYKKLTGNLLKEMSERLRYINEVTVDSLSNEIETKKTQLMAGNFMVLLIVLLTSFTFLLGSMSYLTKVLGTASMITTGSMLILAIIFWICAKKTNYPMSFFGFSAINWRTHSLNAVLYTSPILLFMTVAKWLLIQNVPKFANISLFSFGQSAVSTPGTSSIVILLMGIAYIFISSPIQEILLRGGLQGCLQHFLLSKRRNLLANLTTNLIFGMMHLILSYVLAILAFSIGIFWGWLYCKQRTLVGVIISHMLIGGWAFFILGIQSIVMA